MDLLHDISYLKQFWGVQTVIIGSVTALHVLRGTYTDKTTNQKDVDEKLGLLQFRRRLPAYYLVGLMGWGWVTWNAFSVYFWGGEPNAMLARMITWFTTPVDPSNIGSTRMLLAACLFELHLLRRLNESLAVQVLSRKQVFNPVHALLAFAYYPLAVISLFADAFPLRQHSPWLSMSELRVTDLVSVSLFLVASYVSRQTFVQFAKLRRNRFGHVTNTSYKMPTGSMFQYISCPHYLAEILIYGSISAILGTGSSTWMWLMGYICSKHLYLAHSTHAWYNRKFEDYPQSRKRLIPFLF